MGSGRWAADSMIKLITGGTFMTNEEWYEQYNEEKAMRGEKITNVIMIVGNVAFFLLKVVLFVSAILWLQSHII
jgi:hypothetical protein